MGYGSNTGFTSSWDVTGSLAKDTVYQNGSTKALLVVSGSTGTPDTEVLQIYTDSSNPPTTKTAVAGSGGTPSYQAFVCMPIEPNEYFKITSGGTLTISFAQLYNF
jgi:hypothetical protein